MALPKLSDLFLSDKSIVFSEDELAAEIDWDGQPVRVISDPIDIEEAPEFGVFVEYKVYYLCPGTLNPLPVPNQRVSIAGIKRLVLNTEETAIYQQIKVEISRS